MRVCTAWVPARSRALALALTGILLTTPGIAGDSKSKDPSGLMVHVPLDGSFKDARALGAVRPEPRGTPAFLPGVVGQAALPGSGESIVGELHVTRLSRLMLRGHTPAQGTIMVWCRLAPAADDSMAIRVISSNAPLALTVVVARNPPAVIAQFVDRAGAKHAISAPLGGLDGDDATAETAPSWVHVALGWDSAAGTVTAFVGGKSIAQLPGQPYEMPNLPQQFELGNPRAAIDDFRLYDRLLSPEELATLPGLAGR